jgi:hypothetical protein
MAAVRLMARLIEERALCIIQHLPIFQRFCSKWLIGRLLSLCFALTFVIRIALFTIVRATLGDIWLL